MSDLNIPDNNLYRAFIHAVGEPVTEEKLRTLTELNWNEYIAENAGWEKGKSACLHELEGVSRFSRESQYSIRGGLYAYDASA